LETSEKRKKVGEAMDQKRAEAPQKKSSEIRRKPKNFRKVVVS
jgi:hypothetical protein